MLPVFKEYREMLASFGIDLSQYSIDKLWVDRLIIRGFDKNGAEHKICRLKVTDDLTYECSFYKDLPKNSNLESYEGIYQWLKDSIANKEQESVQVLKDMFLKYPSHQIVLTTSMGKDSKVVEYILKCSTDKPYRKIFNNTTLDCADVYKEVRQRKDVEIVSTKDSSGKPISFYQLIKQWGIPSRHSRWCCSLFKEGATRKYLQNENNILFVMGMRNEESQTRSDYGFERVDENWTNSTWAACLPIRKWTELEIWLYTLHNNIPVNSKYRKGYSRCGCHIACPYYTKSTWVLDKYWYPKSYNRFHECLTKDFIKDEKWYRMNCTLQEYHSKWNGGIVRNSPTDEVIDEFAEYKKLPNRDLVKQYFEKTCNQCGKKLYKKDEVAMSLKYFGRNTTKFLCKKCLMKQFNWSKEDWNKQVEKFKQDGCDLF